MAKILNRLFISGLMFLFLVPASALLSEDFSFVFMTDIHANTSNGQQGFKKAVSVINKLNPDFVLTGGDLVIDATRADKAKATELFDIYMNTLNGLRMPFYNAIGNHDVAGLSGTIPSDDPSFGKNMFQQKVGRLYYSFDHKGWHFIVLDAIGTAGKTYYGHVGKAQVEWLKHDLAALDKKTPIVVVVHIPFFKGVPVLFSSILSATGKNAKSLISNTDEVIGLFEGYNLKAVLSGHLHVYFHVNVGGVDYISGGSIAGRWWHGPMLGTEQGFLMLNVKDDSLNWKYLSFGWKP